MEQLLKTTEPALILASDHLIDLVDRIIERHSREESRQGTSLFQRESLPWVCWGAVQQLAVNHRMARV